MGLATPDTRGFSSWRELAALNRTLGTRVRRRQRFYAAAAYAATAFVAAVWASMLANPDLPTTPMPEVEVQFAIGAAILIFLDLFFVMSRFQKRALVEPAHFQLFPLGRARLVQFVLVAIIADKKSWIYVATSVAFVVFFAVTGGVLGLLSSLVVTLILAVAISVWSATVAFVASLYVPGARQGIVALLPLYAIALNVVMLTGHFGVFLKIPLAGSFAEAMRAIYAGTALGAWSGLLGLVLAVVFGVVALFVVAWRLPSDAEAP